MTAGRALIIDRPGTFRLDDVDPGPPGRGEVLVQVAYTGICGSDREIVSGGRDPALVRYPVIPGHEWSGTVIEAGDGVERSLIGRRVVGENHHGCGWCDNCRRGETTLCEGAYDETGFTRPGAAAETVLVPARKLHLLSDDADLRAAALIEPAACMAAASLAARIVPGERVAIVGGGTLGLLATQFAAACGPGDLVVVDPRSRSMAPVCGATETVTPDEASASRGRFDVVIEAAGAHGTGRLAVELTRRGGRTVLTGLRGGPDKGLYPAALVAAAVTVHTVFGAPSRAWTHAVRAFTAGVLRPEPLISDELTLDRAGLTLRPDSPTPSGKVLLRP